MITYREVAIAIGLEAEYQQWAKNKITRFGGNRRSWTRQHFANQIELEVSR